MSERNKVTNYKKHEKNETIIGISRKTNQTAANSKWKEGGQKRTSVFCLR